MWRHYGPLGVKEIIVSSIVRTCTLPIETCPFSSPSLMRLKLMFIVLLPFNIKEYFSKEEKCTCVIQSKHERLQEPSINFWYT